MTFTLYRTSDWENEITVTVNTIADLKAIFEKYKNEIIIDFDEMTIEIYDDYRE